MNQKCSLSKPSMFYSFLFLLFVLQGTAFGQVQFESCQDIQESKDYFLLGTIGGELNSEIRQLERNLDALQAQIPKAIPEQKIREYRQQIDDLQNKGTNRTAEEERLYQTLLSQTQDAIALEALNGQLSQTRDELEKRRDFLQCIQHRLSSIYSPEQSFKLTMSIAFAALIGLVIAGFFWLSNKDESMRRAIFSGQAGMQFLTLFSIVIAIILFGITSILESKELAALLGGLSGYILGRSSGQREGATEPSLIEKLASIEVKPATVSLTSPSETVQLTAIPRDSAGNAMTDSGSVFKPSWNSSNTEVATVSSTGLVTRISPGTAKITASFNNLTSNACDTTCS